MNVELASANPRRRLRWYQFSLAATLIVVAALCGFLAYWGRPPKPIVVQSPLPQPLLADTDYQWRAALLKPTQLEFNEQPLMETVKYLQDVHSINIRIDTAALDAANIPLDTPVTLALRGVPLRSGLRQILRPLGLEYAILDEVLVITTQPVAERLQVTRVYPIQDLLDEGSGESLLKAISLELEAASDTLPPAGGVPPRDAPAVPPPSATFHGGLLLLRGAYRHHERVQDLLDRMRVLRGMPGQSGKVAE